MRWNKAMSIAAAVVGCILILWSGISEQPPSGWEPMQLGADQPTREQNSSAVQSAASVREKTADASSDNGSERQLSTVNATKGLKDKESEADDPKQDDPLAQSQVQIEENRPSVPDTSPKTVGETNGETDDHGKIDVNTAPISKLIELPGIGEKKAQAIVDYRNAHGPFAKVSDLTKVKGIGMKMLEKMAPYVQIR